MTSEEYLAQEHIKVYMQNFGDIPEKYHVHHIDNNRDNNSPDNLVALPRQFHKALHHNYAFYLSIARRNLVDKKLILDMLEYSESKGYRTDAYFCAVFVEFLLSKSCYSYLLDQIVLPGPKLTSPPQEKKIKILSLDTTMAFVSAREAADFFGVPNYCISNACNSPSQTNSRLNGHRLALVDEDGNPVINKDNPKFKRQRPTFDTSEAETALQAIAEELGYIRTSKKGKY